MLASSDNCNCFSAKIGEIKCMAIGEDISQIIENRLRYSANSTLEEFVGKEG